MIYLKDTKMNLGLQGFIKRARPLGNW